MAMDETSPVDMYDDINATMYDEYDEQCPTYYNDLQWLIRPMFYVGGVVSIISSVENSLLMLALIYYNCVNIRKIGYFFTMSIMACFDAISASVYVLMIMMPKLHPAVYNLYIAYTIYIYTASETSLTSSTFLLIAIQLERYALTTTKWKKALNDCTRATACVIALVFAFVMKFPILFETEVVNIVDDNGQVVTALNSTDLVSNEYYRFYQFYIRHTCCVFMPFTVLLAINIRLVMKLKRSERHAKLFAMTRSITEAQKLRAQSATRAFILVVCTYLISNLINVIIIFWEQTDMSSLVNDHCTFYLVGSDVVSFLTVTSGALRLPIYLFCNPDVRQAMRQLRQCCVPRCCDSDDDSDTEDVTDETKLTVRRHLFGFNNNVNINTRENTDDNKAVVDTNAALVISNGQPEGEEYRMAVNNGMNSKEEEIETETLL